MNPTRSTDLSAPGLTHLPSPVTSRRRHNMAARPHPAALLLLGMALGYISTVSASITCALPAGGSYKAGDPIVLDWGSDGTSPVVTDIRSINGTLYCNVGNRIADVSIPNLTGPFTWSVPSVGNATTVGGTTGVCPQNAFHIEYSGEAAGFLDLTRIPWGPVRCGTITIAPAPNGTLTTTTTAMSSTSTATSTPTTTDPASSSDKGGISTTVVVIIAVVAAILATLSAVALVMFFRKQKRQRKLDKALMPWNTSNMTRFSQVATVDEGSGSPRHSGSGPGAGIGISSVAATGAAAAAAHASKPQPTLPQPSRGTYYSDDGEYNNYGYHHQQQQQQFQQQQLLQQQGYNQQDYDGYTDVDSYYNPYYASSAIGSGTGAAIDQSNPSFYGAPLQSTSGLYLHQQQQQQQYQQHEQLGYVPPPRSVASNTSPGASSTSKPRAPAGTADDDISAPLGSALTSLPTSSSTTSSPKRAPQTVMQEMGRREAEAPLRDVLTPNTTV
ncbi:hypothetical protein EC968_010259 [Mortierella alpina]|nr:hypothetical protein EC968_010259 [Mortierella alpina]